MEAKNRIIIVGAGLAGLCMAIHLRKRGIGVTLIEKNDFRQHKVCGEYISNEVLPYLRWLDIDLTPLQPTAITKLSFSLVGGESTTATLPLGGFGLSRYVLDDFLSKIAKLRGCELLKDKVESVTFTADRFLVATAASGNMSAELVIGAYGKRANLDMILKRDFFFKKSPWLAVKAHYTGDFPADTVALYNFKGGYCGVSKVENDRINICYLSDYTHFKKFRNIEAFEQQVLCSNPKLRAILVNCKPLFEQPLSISQISFARKNPVHHHMLMIGDTAGLIHPLCGNGMAMAIHSAKLCSELIEDFFNGNSSRAELEDRYTRIWNKTFKTRIGMGRLLASLLRNEYLLKPFWMLLVKLPAFLPLIIKKTHGKPIE